MTDVTIAILYAVAGVAVFVLMVAGMFLKDELNKLETRVEELERNKNKNMR